MGTNFLARPVELRQGIMVLT